MTAGIDEAPGYQHGDLVTVADTELVVIQHDSPWVEVVPENGDCGFTVHESEIHR
ncbi:hypothetical protein PV646_28515 [Streptomyces sp. ID05-26A]|nr:hypothetical protein [Streptomyces sp. ID05-26A]